MTGPSVVLLIGCAVSLAAEVRPQDAEQPRIAGIRVGLAGCYKTGLWTPVEVKLQGADQLKAGQVTVTVPDGDGVPSQVFTPLPCPDAADSSANHAATSETWVRLYARFGRARSAMTVELHAAGRMVDRKVFQADQSADYPPALLSDQELVVAVGRAPLGVEEAVRLLQQGGAQKTVVARLDDFGQLPDRWYGYEAVSTVVLSTSDAEVYAGVKPTSPQIAALDEWIHNGGKLLLCVGHRAEEVLRLEPKAALSRFVAPGRLERMVTLPLLADALEVYCGSSVPVPPFRQGFQVPYLTDVEGTIEAREGSLPLVVRTARGFGQVVFVAADLDRPPFDQWADRGLLVGKLLDYPRAPSEEDEEGTAVMHYGYTDLAGQLRSALDQFPSVWRVPFWLVVGLIVVYILAIGPGDYFFLRKVVRRMPLTWITFPVIVVAFSAAAYVLAPALKGDRIRLNQVDLVDVDVPTGRVRGTAWANVFSPRMQRYDLSFRPRLPDGQVARDATTLTAWLGLPGDALGGMNPRTTEPAIWRSHYQFSQNLDALGEVPIQVWSTKSLTGRWTARTDVGLQGQLREQDHSPTGTITNSLGFPLVDCLLAYGTYAYELGTIEPGQSVQVGPNLLRRGLASLLTGRRQIVFDEDKNRYRVQAEEYKRTSVDVVYILRMMMFFEAGGGRPYTGLSNRYQGFVDGSRLLKTNRAVLFGRVPEDAAGTQHCGAELLCNGQPLPESQVRHTTIYRFVFTVEPEGELLAAGEQ